MADALSPQGFDPLPTQRVPLCTVLRYPFLVADPKTFLKAPTSFEGGVRAEKTQFFWSKFFKQCLKTPFLACIFFQNFACGTFFKTGSFRVYIVLWESSENQFGRPKKKVDKIFEIFSKIRPPPLKKILDPLLISDIPHIDLSSTS